MKVKEHIMNFIKHRASVGDKTFYTHEIQTLSEKGLIRFNRRLGSPSTYERTFRLLREDGYLDVRKIENPKSRESRWEIRGDYA
tara:strand:+ start:951 stop:1202 length:252 start_codon:yes stop_codon:yes gene_type:complete